jgi:uncharacterized protein YcbX
MTAAGLALDRNWMVVDRSLGFVTQREMPRLALVATRLEDDVLHLSAPGMPDLVIGIGESGELLKVEIWGKTGPAYAQSAAADDWFTRFAGEPLRLVRSDPAHPRVSDRTWTDGVTALNRFSDGFPLLVISEQSLDDLNRRLAVALPMNRFRPNIVLAGVPAYAEDRLDTLTAGEIVLRIVKPCGRCAIVNTDQATAAVSQEPLRMLATYRRNARIKGGAAFGQNAIVLAGAGATLRVGQELGATWLADAAA